MAEDGYNVGNGDGAEQDGLEIALTFSYEPEGITDELFGVTEETLFTAFECALEAVGVDQSVEVSVLVTTDEGIRALNREYRGKDEATDVLSFPLLDEPLVDAPEDQLWQPDDDDERPLDAEDEREAHISSDADDGAEYASETADDAADDEATGEIEEDGDDDEWPLHLGDIAIARETVIRQAEKAGHSAAYEAAYLFVHGVLHLVGYDDQTDAGYRAMVAIQERTLAQVGVAH